MRQRKQQLNKNHTSQAVGLDIALALVNFITGKDNLHYGFWDEIEVNLGNLGHAQDAYTEKLLSYLPEKKNLKILDVGGGGGETAKLLLKLGHKVTIVVPSPILAARSKQNTNNKANIEVCNFEDYICPDSELFDVCLFSESFQYIPLKEALFKASKIIHKHGKILIADCFRSSVKKKSNYRPPGGGHYLSDVIEGFNMNNLEVVKKEEITKHVSPSIDIEQKFYNTLGTIIKRISDAFSQNYPIIFKIINFIYYIFINKNKRKKIQTRLFDSSRNSKIFEHYNHYMIFLLEPKNY